MKTQRRQHTVIFILTAAILSLLTALLFLSHTRYAKAENSYISPDTTYSVSESSNTESEQNINGNTVSTSEANNAEQQNATDNFKVSKILDSGKPDSESLVLTVMGDGFTENQQGDFKTKAKNGINDMLGIGFALYPVYPFSNFADYFTVYAVEVISEESGVCNDVEEDIYKDNDYKSITVNNYFGSSFYDGQEKGGRQRSLVIKNKDKAEALTQPHSIATVVLCNSETFGGASVGQLITTSTKDVSNTLAHELGHALGGLEEEYYYTDDFDDEFVMTEAPNCTKNLNNEVAKWQKWNGYKDIGVYSYGEDAEVGEKSIDPESYKWYKPSKKCKMKDVDYKFCPVCSQVLFNKMENKLGKRVFDLSVIADGTEVFIDKLNITARDKFIIPDRIDGLPVTEIRSFAFEDQTLCKEFILPEGLRAIGRFAFRGCTALSGQIKIPASLTFYGDGAFYGCDNLRFEVASDNKYFSYVDNKNTGLLYNKNHTAIIQACKLPNYYSPPHVDFIAPYAFAGNGNLQILKFNNDITTISEYAFSDCDNLSEVVFNSEVTKIDDRAFADCANLGVVMFKSNNAPAVGSDVLLNDDITIYVPYNAQSTYKAAFSQYASRIDSVRFPVYFMDGEHVIETRDVYYGSTISLPDYSPVGYDLIGWYDNPGFTGEPYVNGDIWMNESSTILYAKTEPQDCTVIFDGNGGIIESNNIINVKYDSNFQANINVTKEGCYLDGWYDDNGIKYLTADGQSLRSWNKVGITTLKAKWHYKTFTIRIDTENKQIWIGPQGLQNEAYSFPYNSIIDLVNLIHTFKHSPYGYREGHIFEYFKLPGEDEAWSGTPVLTDNHTEIILEPEWKPENHKLVFVTKTDPAIVEFSTDYGENIVYPDNSLSRTGYTFSGWFTDEKYTKPFNDKKMPDLTENNQSNGSKTLYAYWVAIQYSIRFHTNFNQVTKNSTIYDYDKTFNLEPNTFMQNGHDFKGWALSPSGNVKYTDGQRVSNLTNKQGDVVDLYAVWQVKVYKIIFMNLGSNMSAYPNTYTYGVGLLSEQMPVIRVIDPNGRSYQLQTFYGWFTNSSFKIRVSDIPQRSMGDTVLYAKYDYNVLSIHDNTTYTIKDSGYNSNPYIEIPVMLKSSIYDKFKNTTNTKIRIDVSFDLWEIDDGYQYLALIKDEKIVLFPNSNIIWSKKIDHSGGKKTYSYKIELNLDDYKDKDSLYLRFNADGAFSDTWKFNNFNLSVYLVN